ncbi:hypothetical protein PAPHI01_2000 [Pancytospora philotis]|nr:hypothetical protein PAPHI01_2000 [Pancytospora philotis]
MDVYYALRLLLALFLVLISLSSYAIAAAKPSPLAKAEDQDRKVNEMLFQCYYPGQPVVPKGERLNGSLPILHGICESDIFTRGAAQRVRRHRVGRLPRSISQDREEENEEAAADVSESSESERPDALYSALVNARYSPPSAARKAQITFNESGQPVLTYTDPENSDSEQENNLSILYDEMWNKEPADADRVATPVGHYYLRSKRFVHYLATWEKNSANAKYHISQDDVDRIRDELDAGTPFHRLSEYNKQLFAKLVFVRNALETYGMIRVVMKPLGLRVDGHRTADEFLRAMYGYLMAVQRSHGRFVVAFPVAASILTGELFSLAYADCRPDSAFVEKNGEENAEKYFKADRAHLYIRHIIIMFRAWRESTNAAIEPDVLLRITGDINNYVNHSENYDDGCQQLAFK